MPLFKLCEKDELVNTLQGVFKANIIRIPEARIRPLCVIAATPAQPRFWGYLNELIEGNILNPQSAIQESRMADVSGKRSRSINLDLGLQILQGYLSGFGLPAAGIVTQFKGAKTVSFSFQEVMRKFISPSQLGSLLKDHALDADHASNDIFFRKEAQLLVTDSIITSKDFSIQVDKANSHNFSLDVPAIEQMIGQANTNVQVASNTGLDITFKGSQALAFAFTCLVCELDAAGRISLKPSSESIHFATQRFEPKLLFDTSGMLEWD